MDPMDTMDNSLHEFHQSLEVSGVGCMIIIAMGRKVFTNEGIFRLDATTPRTFIVYCLYLGISNQSP